LRSSRNSADSVAVTPGRLPSSISASLSHRCRHDSEIPKSFAICANGASPLRATATTSRRNSAGNAFGMTDILPARNRSSQVRSQPNRGQTLVTWAASWRSHRQGMSSSWGHAAARLDPETIDEHDRWGRRCSARRCVEPVTHVSGYRYVTGRAGRVSWAERRVCEGQAARFAQRHQIEIGPAPTRAGTRPADEGSPVVYRGELRRVRGRPPGEWSLSLARAGGGGLASWSVSEFTAAGRAGLDEAVHAADVFLARGRMLVAQEGWQRAGERATAALVPVTDTPAWRGVSWACTVACRPDVLSKPTWYL